MTIRIDTDPGGTGARPGRMEQLFDGDTITDWTTSNRLSLDGFNSEIEGTGCVAISLAKNSTVTYTYTAPTPISVPRDSSEYIGPLSSQRRNTPDEVTGLFPIQAIINSYTTIGSILNTYSITITDDQSPTAGTATYDILPEFIGETSSLTLKSFVATALDLTAGTLAFADNITPEPDIASIDFNYDVQNVNLRAVDNAFIDVGWAGSGITVGGRTDSDSLFREMVDADISQDLHTGVIQEFEGVIFAQHNIRLDLDSFPGNFISRNENLTFVETLNGSNKYVLEIDGGGFTSNVEFLGTNIQATGDCILDVLALGEREAFVWNGGSLKNARSFLLWGSKTGSTGVDQRISNCTFDNITYLQTGDGGYNNDSEAGFFKNNTLSNISRLWIESNFQSNTVTNCDSVRTYGDRPFNKDLRISDCTFTNCGQIDTTLFDSGNESITERFLYINNSTFDSCGRSSGSALFADSETFNFIAGCTFIRDVSTNAAVELRVDKNLTLDWDNNTLIGYGTGIAGNDIASIDSGAIAVDFLFNSTLTLNVINGSTVPTIKKIGTGTVNITNNAIVSLTRLLGNTEISVLDNPSPYSATSLPAPSVTTIASTERVSADTLVGNGGSNYLGYFNSGGFVRLIAAGITVFSDFPGVLQDTNATNPRDLAAGDRIRVTIRDEADNPTLQLFDEFVVADDFSTVNVIDTTTPFSGFTSVFGDTLFSSNSKTVTVEKVDARFQFETPVNNVIDILAYRTGSDPVLSLENTAVTGNILLPQTGDRNYRDPA